MRKALSVALHFAEYAVTMAEAIPGYQVTTIVSARNYRDEIPVGVQRPDVIEIDISKPRNPLVFVKAVAVFVGALRRLKPSVVHFQEYPTGLFLLYWLLAAAHRRVLTVHDVQPHVGADSAWPRRRYWIRDRVRSSAAAIVVHGETLKSQLLEAMPALTTRVGVVPHVAMRAKRYVDGDNVRPGVSLLFFGRIERYKGLHVLLDALGLAREKGSSVRLRIAGAGTELEALRAHIEAINGVEVLGRRLSPAEVTEEMLGCDAVVLPYIEASQSGVVSLAFGHGRPVVATRVGAIPEVVKDGVNGLLVAPGNPGDLMQALSRIEHEDGLLSTLKNGAAQSARSELSPAVVGRMIATVYSDAGK